MPESLFSERHGLAPLPGPQVDDFLPPWVREAIVNYTNQFTNNPPPGQLAPSLDVYPLIRPYVWKVLNREPATTPMGGPWVFYIPRTLTKCAWWQFYDILEQICRLISQRWGNEYVTTFAENINAIFAKERIPWKMDQGRVVRSLSPQQVEVIEQARRLLTNPRFRGPDEQFEKAVEFLNRRPAPDEENCLKDAVGALEAVANIIAGTNGVQLNILLDRDPYRSGIHLTIKQAIEKIYAFRGVAPGVAHGQVGPPVVTIAEATWVLVVSAVTMLYFVEKFPQ